MRENSNIVALKIKLPNETVSTIHKDCVEGGDHIDFCSSFARLFDTRKSTFMRERRRSHKNM